MRVSIEVLVVLALAIPCQSEIIVSQDDASESMTEVRGPGTPPEDSVADYRWYWDYEDRYVIGFEFASGSDDISDGSDKAAVRQAMLTWNSVPDCSINCWASDFYDGEWRFGNFDNEIIWIEGAWETFFRLCPFLPEWRAVTVVRESGPGRLECDIYFNGEHFSWYTDSDDSGQENTFVQTIALREVGRALSLVYLDGLEDADRVMYAFTYDREEKTTLHPLDIASLQYAYPVPIPEPSTLLLLGLGAVMVKRRLLAC